MTKYIFVLNFLIWSISGSAQKTFKGILLDSASHQPVEYANIGLIGKGFGTVTNEKGEYSFTVPDSVMDQNIRVSMIGYAARTYKANDFQKLSTIRLRQITATLNEVTVTAKKMKLKVLGNETQTKVLSAGFTKNNLGAELAVKLNIKHPKTEIRKFAFNINKNSLNTLPVFRVNVYNMGKNGFPDQNILKQNIILEPKEMTGLIEVDLSPYGLVVDDDVFVAIEWIKDLGDARGLYFSSRIMGATTYYRLISQDEWKKESAVGIGLYAEVAY